jgi:hypothetical protein
MLKTLTLSLVIGLLPYSISLNAQNTPKDGCLRPDTIPPQTRYTVEQFIVRRLQTSRIINPEELDAVIGFEGCLQSQRSGTSANIYVYRWEAEDGKAIEVRWHNQFFQKWKGENF